VIFTMVHHRGNRYSTHSAGGRTDRYSTHSAGGRTDRHSTHSAGGRTDRHCTHSAGGRTDRHSTHSAGGRTDILKNLGKIIPVVLITNNPDHTITTPEVLSVYYVILHGSVNHLITIS
jgi:hypothetical protein